jgi:N-acyl-D-aspartate/D-glutamate deacylase
VLDGTGRPAYRADVGVARGRIRKVGDLSRETATEVIEASGLIVAPGFINIHSHALLSALPTAANMLKQGVTTEILNPDGFGPNDIEAQLAGIASLSPAVNVGAYAPFNAAWERYTGTIDRRPTTTDLALITAQLERGLDAGAWGISAGLEYKPASYARTDEVVAVLAPLRGWRTNFANHVRVTPDTGFSGIVGARETIEIGERAGLLPVITHMKVPHGKADEALDMLRAATARGVFTAADVYPYLAGAGGLAAIFAPGWAYEGGRAAFVERLRDPATRARIVRDTEAKLLAIVGTPENLRVVSRNQTLAELMVAMGTTSPGEVVARILEAENPGMIATFGTEPDLAKLMQYADVAIACDCGATRTSPHPRAFGTFPRVLGHYVRESSALSLADAVRKMTGLPSSIIGMVDRGFIAAGMAADLTVLDAVSVIDRATYDKPTEPSEGIRFVVVNGRIALRDGEPTGVKAGRTLRRTRAMPSRPMSVSASRELRTEADESGRRIKVDLAAGQLRVAGPNWALAGTEFGLIQTAPRWSTMTGIVRETRTGSESAFVLIVDEVGRSMTLQVDRRPAMTWKLKVLR